VEKIQCNIKTFLARTKYEKLENKIICIQKAIREYLFLKKGAKRLFDKTYSFYE
jgi:hypothetical protein